jgi:hypothetical protein
MSYIRHGEWNYQTENEDKIDKACTTHGREKGMVGKPEGKRPLGRPRHRWENNIKMDLTV